ncbi:MAG: UvrD-helicase domain-containing protein [Chitinophagales bacterium]
MLNIYKSSAGSGKTYTLVREFLRMSLQADGPGYRSILAITFTNKAANEMKSRVLQTLESLTSNNPPAELMRALCNDLTLPEEELQRRAAFTHHHMLHHYADLSVSTIDSFVNRLVRSYAHDLHLQADFRVELDQEVLLSRAVDQVLQMANSQQDTPLTRALIDFAEDRLSEGKGWHIENDLIQLGRQLFREAAAPYIEQLGSITENQFQEARKLLLSIRNQFEKSIQEHGAQMMQLIASRGLQAADFFQTSRGIWKYMVGCRDFNGQMSLQPDGYAATTINQNKWYTARKGKETEQASIEAIKPQLLALIDRVIQLSETAGASYFLAKLLLKNSYSFMLLSEVQKQVHQIQEAEGLLHISEFQRRIGHIVRDQPAPFIYERIGQKYNQILIDEFQDTSVLQWQNLVPLVENSLMELKDSLIVGDGKQAIYRFRGGEVAQFICLPKLYGSDHNPVLKERENVILNYGSRVLQLNKNYRSLPQIVSFNNQLYGMLKQDADFALSTTYEGVEQEAATRKTGGYVRLEFLPAGKKDEVTQNRHHRMKEILHELMAKGFRWKDIALLSRSNQVGSAAAAFLLENNIPVVSAESVLIDQSPLVQSVLSALRYLTDRNNAIVRSEMMHALNTALLQDITASFTAIPDTTYRDFIRQPYPDFEQQFSILSGSHLNSDQLLTQRLPEVVDAIAAALQIPLTGNPFMQFFRDAVLEFSSVHGHRISDFLEWWSDKRSTASVIFPEDLDAVRIMTIHKSKGLQFPVVLLIEADFNCIENNSSTLFWASVEEWLPTPLPFYPIKADSSLLQTPLHGIYEREQHELQLDMLNALYVATTRPEDALFILGTAPKTATDQLKSVTAVLTRFLQHQNNWQGFEQIYEWGEWQPAQRGDEKKLPTYDPGQLSAHQQKLSLRKVHQSSQQDAQEFGNLLHQLMASISYKDSAPRIQRKFFYEQQLPTGLQDRLIATVNQILDDPQLRHYFQPPWRVLAERPLADGKGQLLIPDRIVFHPETQQYALFDFKTGAPEPAHHQQILSYAKILKHQGLQLETVLLVYTSPWQITPVSL